jgi:hypothetical protein
MAWAVVAATPDRIIRGSHDPRLSFVDLVGSVRLFNLLAGGAAEEVNRRNIFLENPAALFGL